MDGMEVIRRLHDISALTEAVVLTGNASVDSAVRALREHTCDYLVKPVAPPQLLSTLARAGDRWQRRIAEDALLRSEERSQRLLENISDIVAVVDENVRLKIRQPVAHPRARLPTCGAGRTIVARDHPSRRCGTDPGRTSESRSRGARQSCRARPDSPRQWRLAVVGGDGGAPGESADLRRVRRHRRAWSSPRGTSRIGGGSRTSCARRRRWRASGGWPVAWPTISTTC